MQHNNNQIIYSNKQDTLSKLNLTVLFQGYKSGLFMTLRLCTQEHEFQLVELFSLDHFLPTWNL